MHAKSLRSTLSKTGEVALALDLVFGRIVSVDDRASVNNMDFSGLMGI